MFAFRTLGLLISTLAFLGLGVESSAQVKMPPQIKPGLPPTGKPPATDPGKGKLPSNPTAPGTAPGGVGLPPATPPGTPGGASVPEKKKDDIKWPKEWNGKDLETTIKDMRTHSDPAVREAAVRALPMFGPKGREAGADDLIDVMKKDPDWNVRLAAISVGPVEFMSWIEVPDAFLTTGLATLSGFLGHEQLQVKLEALTAVSAVGPYMRQVNFQIISRISSIARSPSAWQLRRAATATLGSVGQGIQISPEPDKHVPPDTAAVDTLLTTLRGDPCAAVRREAVNSLISLGPVTTSQHKKWRADLDLVLKLEKDKSVRLWTHVLIIRNDTTGLKGNEQHLEAIAKVLQAPEAGGRVEACQALALLGEEAVTKLDDLIAIINKDAEKAVVIAAILAITNMPTRAAASVPILQKVKVNHMDADVRKVASDAIEYLAGLKKKK